MKNETDEIVRILDEILNNPKTAKFQSVRVKFSSRDGGSVYLHYPTRALQNAVKNETGMLYDVFGKIPKDSWLDIDRAKQALGHEPLAQDIAEITHGTQILYERKETEHDYRLSISYSWGDAEPDLFFDAREKAWTAAKNMALAEAENSLEDADNTDEAEIRIFPEKGKIVLTYACAYGGDTAGYSTCTYLVEKEK